MRPINAKELLRKYADGTCTEAEKQLFEQWYNDLNRTNRIQLSEVELEDAEKEILNTLLPKIQSSKRVVLWPRIAAAASVLFFLSIGIYFLLHKTPRQFVQNQPKNIILPGSNKATLTLSNGKQISLADAQNGILAKQGNRIIKKASNGTVSYESDGTNEKNQRLTYNTISTPKGGQWPLILPDGTKVMLDAASSIKYPVYFTGNERKVEITGQAYFEVVHNAAMPFRVLTKNQVIEDIGTKFNINTYDDESAVKTTLLEGAVKVSVSNNLCVMLKPGQQTVWQNNRLTVAEANLEEALDWKNGYFSLDDENIQSIMRKLSRWYDIKVEYKGNIPNMTLRGEIPRNTPIAQVLKVLEDANFHFTIEGKKITVTP